MATEVEITKMYGTLNKIPSEVFEMTSMADIITAIADANKGKLRRMEILDGKDVTIINTSTMIVMDVTVVGKAGNYVFFTMDGDKIKVHKKYLIIGKVE